MEAKAMKMTMLKCLSAAAAAMLVAGCASTGERLDASIGQPVEQLVQALGQPDADFRVQTGERVLQWKTWSTRKEPRNYYSTPRMTHAVQTDPHGVGYGEPGPLAQAYDVDQFAIAACVVWVAVDDQGVIEKGAAHGSGC
jgi:hypothetical protein